MCNALKQLSILILFTSQAVIAIADNRVIGTVELTVDGEQQTWYVLQPDGDMPPTAMWLAMGPDTAALSIAAYADAAMPFVADEMSGAPMPDSDAAVLQILIGFPVGASNTAYSLPNDGNAGVAKVVFFPDWRQPVVAYDLDGAPGRIELTLIDANTEGTSRFAGQFSGTLQNGEGDSMTVAAGRFEVDGVVFFAR